jgi:hypothetical protein
MAKGGSRPGGGRPPGRSGGAGSRPGQGGGGGRGGGGGTKHGRSTGTRAMVWVAAAIFGVPFAAALASVGYVVWGHL